MRAPALLIACALVAGLASPTDAQSEPVAATESRDFAPLVGRLIDGFLRPAHADLVAAARGHGADWQRFCSARERAGLERVAASFRRLADAWARIEFVRYGPITEDFRAERINFWPDKRNATTRGLAGLLAADAPEPTVATVRAASAATQGLPALERLLFDPGAAERLVAAKDEGARACAVGRAVAGNVAEVAEAVAAGWEPLAEAVKTDRALAREAAARLTTDLLGEFQTLIDAKLLPAMGKAIEAAKPEALEGRHAGRVRESFARPLAGLPSGTRAAGRALKETPA